MEACRAGGTPRKTLEDNGFSVELIGERRFFSIPQHIREEFKKHGENVLEGYQSSDDELKQEYRKVGALLMNDSSFIYEIIQETPQATDNSLSVSSLCSMSGVFRSGYYAWLKATPIRKTQEQRDREDFDLILEAYRMYSYSKGAKAIYVSSPYGVPCHHEPQKNTETHEQTQPVMPCAQGKPLPKDGQGPEDHQRSEQLAATRV